MTSDDNDPVAKGGILAHYHKNLLAGVFSFGVAGALLGVYLASVSTPAFAQSQASETTAQPFSFANVVEKVRPSVVSIKVKTETSAGNEIDNNDGLPDPFQFFFRFGPNGMGSPFRAPRKELGVALGSGFLISPDGYVVTNNHVVAHATSVQIVTDAGKAYAAKVIGTDPKTDLALLKVKGDETFAYVQFEAQSQPRVGDWVIAVGNPYGLGGTVTAGIVSTRGRDIGDGSYNDFLQIDAPVNHGNSGGPTFDLAGRVVGVNTAIYSSGDGGSIGIGFDIPADTAADVVAQLKAYGKVTRGYIGIRAQPVTRDIADSIGMKKASGAIVADVTRGGPAARAGIEAGDAITAVNGRNIANSRDLARTIADIKPGDTADLTVWRNGKDEDIKVETTKLPGDWQLAGVTSTHDDDSGGQSFAGLGLDLAPASTVPGQGDIGVVVTNVDSDGAAADHLQTGDVILNVAGRAVNSLRDVRQALSSVRSDGKSAILLRVRNGSGVHFVVIEIGRA